ncbi:unnamed protein product, partial [marine sediment metagenome]
MPILSGLHVDKTLTGLSLRFTNPEVIFELAVPTINVKHETDKYFTYDKSHLRIEEDVRADKSLANKASYDLDSANYSVQEHALEDLVTPRMLQNADGALEPSIDATNNLMSKITLRLEVDGAATIFATANYSSQQTLAGANKWSVNTASQPILNVASACSEVLSNCGRTPNTAILGRLAFKALKNNDEILDAIKHTQTGIVTKDILRANSGL